MGSILPQGPDGLWPSLQAGPPYYQQQPPASVRGCDVTSGFSDMVLGEEPYSFFESQTGDETCALLHESQEGLGPDAGAESVCML